METHRFSAVLLVRHLPSRFCTWLFRGRGGEMLDRWSQGGVALERMDGG